MRTIKKLDICLDAIEEGDLVEIDGMKDADGNPIEVEFFDDRARVIFVDDGDKFERSFSTELERTDNVVSYVFDVVERLPDEGV